MRDPVLNTAEHLQCATMLLCMVNITNRFWHYDEKHCPDMHAWIVQAINTFSEKLFTHVHNFLHKMRLNLHELILHTHTWNTYVPVVSNLLHLPSWPSFRALTSKSYVLSGWSPDSSVSRMLVMGALTVILW